MDFAGAASALATKQWLATESQRIARIDVKTRLSIAATMMQADYRRPGGARQ